MIYTARGMGSNAGNSGCAVATIGEVTLTQLKDWDIPFDEIHFGKPSADFYVDDKFTSIENLRDLLGITVTDNKEILEYRVSQIEGKIATELQLIASKLVSLGEKVGASSVTQAELQIQVRQMKEQLEALDEKLDSTRTELTGVKIGLAEKLGPGAIAGTIAAVVVALIKELAGL